MNLSNLKTKTKLNLCVLAMVASFLIGSVYMLYQIQRIARAGDAMAIANSAEAYYSRARLLLREYTIAFNETAYKTGHLYLDSMKSKLDELNIALANSRNTEILESLKLLTENMQDYSQCSEELFAFAADVTKSVNLTQEAIERYMQLVMGDPSLSNEVTSLSFLAARDAILCLERRDIPTLEKALARMEILQKKNLPTNLADALLVLKTDITTVREQGATVLATIQKAGTKTDKIVQHFDVMLQQFVALHKSVERNALIFSLVFLLAILAVALIASQMVGNFVVRQLHRILSLLQKCAQGDFTFKIGMNDRVYNDEFGELTIALDVMIEKIRETIHEIQTGAANVADASGQLSAASQRISQGTNDQSASTEEVSSAMEEMYANIDQNSDGAVQANGLARMMEQHIAELSDKVGESMTSVQAIHEKISIVSEIARQTNILALNAAVEAARAGEHGKGFSVVASEVRKLAERSRDSAREISDLSMHSLSTTETAVKNLKSVLPDVHKTAHLVEEIATASTEQKSGVDQINVAIQALNDVVQSNAASSEELATSAEELNAQADLLRDATRFFRIA